MTSENSDPFQKLDSRGVVRDNLGATPVLMVESVWSESCEGDSERKDSRMGSGLAICPGSGMCVRLLSLDCGRLAICSSACDRWLAADTGLCGRLDDFDAESATGPSADINAGTGFLCVLGFRTGGTTELRGDVGVVVFGDIDVGVPVFGDMNVDMTG